MRKPDDWGSGRKKRRVLKNIQHPVKHFGSESKKKVVETGNLVFCIIHNLEYLALNSTDAFSIMMY